MIKTLLLYLLTDRCLNEVFSPLVDAVTPFMLGLGHYTEIRFEAEGLTDRKNIVDAYALIESATVTEINRKWLFCNAGRATQVVVFNSNDSCKMFCETYHQFSVNGCVAKYVIYEHLHRCRLNKKMVRSFIE